MIDRIVHHPDVLTLQGQQLPAPQHRSASYRENRARAGHDAHMGAPGRPLAEWRAPVPSRRPVRATRGRLCSGHRRWSEGGVARIVMRGCGCLTFIAAARSAAQALRIGSHARMSSARAGGMHAATCSTSTTAPMMVRRRVIFMGQPCIQRVFGCIRSGQVGISKTWDACSAGSAQNKR
jgi:hypothetical protein